MVSTEASWWNILNLKIHTTLGYIVSLILLNLGLMKLYNQELCISSISKLTASNDRNSLDPRNGPRINLETPRPHFEKHHKRALRKHLSTNWRVRLANAPTTSICALSPPVLYQLVRELSKMWIGFRYSHTS